MTPKKATKTLVRAPYFNTESSDGLLYGLNMHSKSTTDSAEKHIDKYDDNKNIVLMKYEENSSFLKTWEKKMGFQTELIWSNIIFISLLHLISVGWLGYNLAISYYPKWQSVLYGEII